MLIFISVRLVNVKKLKSQQFQKIVAEPQIFNDFWIQKSVNTTKIFTKNIIRIFFEKILNNQIICKIKIAVQNISDRKLHSINYQSLPLFFLNHLFVIFYASETRMRILYFTVFADDKKCWRGHSSIAIRHGPHHKDQNSTSTTSPLNSST